jgi:rhodanese-related sulfurtransferase
MREIDIEQAASALNEGEAASVAGGTEAWARPGRPIEKG